MKLLVSTMGGPGKPRGLYFVNTSTGEQRQLIEVEGRGLAKVDGGYILAHTLGVIRFDDQFNVVESLTARPVDFHGAVLHNGNFYIVHTALDRIGVYSIDPLVQQGLLAPLQIRPSINRHMNDISSDGNSLIVSMFSTRHTWREDLQSGQWFGAIFRFNPSDPAATVEQLARELKMPHSVKMIGEKLHYCESFDLTFVAGDKRYKMNGYPRGVAFDGRYYYVGLSKLRYVEKEPERFENINPISTGTIVIIDSTEAEADKRIELPCPHVYDILVIDNGL